MSEFPSLIAGKSIKIQSDSLSSRASDILREMIITGSLEQGRRLTELELAAALGISRACIREAVMALEDEGLVERVHNKYTAVVVFTAADAAEIYQLRAAVESMCVGLAMETNSNLADRLDSLAPTVSEYAEKIRTHSFNPDDVFRYLDNDMKFHELIVHSSGNDRAKAIWTRLANQVKTILYAAAIKAPDVIYSPDNIFHDKIVEAIRSGKSEFASRTLRDHILKGLVRVIL